MDTVSLLKYDSQISNIFYHVTVPVSVGSAALVCSAALTGSSVVCSALTAFFFVFLSGFSFANETPSLWPFRVCTAALAVSASSLVAKQRDYGDVLSFYCNGQMCKPYKEVGL